MFLHYVYGRGTIFQLYFAADINNSIISQCIKTMIIILPACPMKRIVFMRERGGKNNS